MNLVGFDEASAIFRELYYLVYWPDDPAKYITPMQKINGNFIEEIVLSPETVESRILHHSLFKYLCLVFLLIVCLPNFFVSLSGTMALYCI